MNKSILDANEVNSIYENIEELVINSREKVYATVNIEMLNLYWNIGKIIIKIQDGKRRAKYGDYVLQEISERLTP